MVVFDPEKHIKSVLGDAGVSLLRSNGTVLPGILGKQGAGEDACVGMRIGIDRLVLQPGSEFELHTHPGDHILYVLASRGVIHVDGSDFVMRTGDTVYVPANYAHGVRTDPSASDALEILAFGVPHTPLDSPRRMTMVADASASSDAGNRGQ